MPEKIKLGCVDFLNGLPLIYPLESGLLPHPFEIVKDVPSVLVDKLHKGEIDIALASTGALMHLGPDFSYIPGIGICSDGPVYSVLSCHNGDVKKLKRIYPDPASVTANLLAKIILDKLYGVKPDFLGAEGNRTDIGSLSDGEGCVLIGDRALQISHAEHRSIDLGEAWRELTGLPFVYALWIGHKEFITDEVRIPLHNAYLMGQSMIPDIIAGQTGLPLPEEAAINYLREHIIYEVSDSAEDGLSRFLKLAEEYV